MPIIFLKQYLKMNFFQNPKGLEKVACYLKFCIKFAEIWFIPWLCAWMTYAYNTTDMKKIKDTLIVMWSILAAVMFAIVFLFVSIIKGWSGYLPDTSELENPEYLYASQLITADGKEMGTWSLRENRIRVEFKDIPQNLIDALVATEDVRYYEHSGIDAQSLLRVGFKSILLQQESSGGGSTITQQLAKMLHTKPESGMMARLRQKPNEWVIAAKLEKSFTKNEILTMYLNKYDFGNNAVGLASAAHVYFGKHPSELKTEESAMLVGMCKNSSLYNPLRRYEKTLERRNVVLSQMAKAGYITGTERDSLSSLPLGIDYHTTDHNEGVAPYFREYLRVYMTATKPERKNYRGWQMQQYYDDSLRWETDSLYGWCNRNFKPNGEKYNIYTDGLRIYTTIDSRMQAYLEDAVKAHVADTLQTRFFKENNPKNAKTKAVRDRLKKTAPYSSNLKQDEVEAIMARNMKQTERYRIMKKNGSSDAEIQKAFNTKRTMKVFTYDGVKDTVMTPMDSIRYYKHFLRTGAMSMDPLSGEVKAYVGGTNYHYFKYDMVSSGRRQVGSTIKPFLYSLAMERGFSPCDETRNVEQTLLDDLGRVWKPRNSGSEKVGEMVTLAWGLAKSNNWISAWLMNQLSPYSLKKLIHEFGLTNRQIEATQSLCLGTCDASVSEMVSAYTAFVGKGMRVAPLLVTRIEDNAGNVVATFSAHRNEVISRNSSYKMIDMMRGVINLGTGRRVRAVYKITADMCGKTGTTQNMSDGWFIGYTPSLVTGCWVGGEERDIHFDNMTQGQGAAMALPIYGLYMQKVYADESLPYNQEETFDIPEDFDPCRSNFQQNFDFDIEEKENPGVSDNATEGDEVVEEIVEDDDYAPVYYPTTSTEEEQQDGFDDLFDM